MTETAGQRDHDYFAAALAWTGDPKKMNGGGPIWAIFDADAVAREKWQVKPPYVDPEGYFFSADTIEELAKKIVNEYQWRPMPPDGAAQDGGALQFLRRHRHRTRTSTSPSRCSRSPSRRSMRRGTRRRSTTPTPGIRSNTQAQVIDLHGKADPGPLCLRRCSRRIRPAWHLPRGDIRPHRGHHAANQGT